MALKILTSLLLLALTIVANAQPLTLRDPAAVRQNSAASGGGSPTYLLSEDFEGTGYDATLGAWTENLNAGTVNEDYTTTVIDGSQSLIVSDDAAAFCRTQSASWSYVEPFYVYFKMRVNSTAGDGAGYVMMVMEGSTIAGGVQVSSSGQLRCDGNVDPATSYTSGTISSNTTYHVWVTFNTSVSPCAWSVGFSTDGVRPTSGANFVSGTSEVTTGCSSVAFGVFKANIDVIIDKVRVSATQIGDNPT